MFYCNFSNVHDIVPLFRDVLRLFFTTHRKLFLLLSSPEFILSAGRQNSKAREVLYCLLT